MYMQNDVVENARPGDILKTDIKRELVVVYNAQYMHIDVVKNARLVDIIYIYVYLHINITMYIYKYIQL